MTTSHKWSQFRSRPSRKLLVLSGGHPYEEEPFEELLQSLGGWDVTHLIHPEAEEAVADGAADHADALLFYDMGGYHFADGAVTTRPPSPEFRAAIMRRFASGKSAVAMHHALAGWAEWPEWSKMLGGRFLYQPGQWQGRTVLDSGYRHDVSYDANVVSDHPVTAGLPPNFPMRDELYLAQIDEASVTPLIRAQYDFKRENFYSAAKAVQGEKFARAGWKHENGSDLIAWTRQVGGFGKSQGVPLVYLQFGDDSTTYRNPHVRQILSNALNFTAGENHVPD